MAVALAVATGIAPTVWADEGEQAMVTAIELLKRANSNTPERDPGQPQMSG